MEWLSFLLHIDKYLGLLVQNYNEWVYFILFAIIFIETGVVIMPFLPGDSLIFIVGTFSAAGYFNLLLMWVILVTAAIAGDSLNYLFGSYFGKRIARMPFVKKEYMEKTESFYDKYGAKTIIIARFVPIVRTFAPFIAGIGKMNYRTFLIYNIVGGLIWVSLFLFGGYYLGTIPFVENNLTLVTVGIILLSLVPPFIEIVRVKRKA